MSGADLNAYTQEPWLDEGKLAWREGATESADREVLRPVSDPFSADGGLKLLQGNLGRSVIKVSAVKPAHRSVEAPARIFDSQQAVSAAFKAGELHRDVILVVRGQGPRANGMPELHKLTPALASLMAQGHKVALVTDGRMSGASGSVPAAIHVSPEVLSGGPLGKLRDGDVVRLDSTTGTLEARVNSAVWAQRHVNDANARHHGTRAGHSGADHRTRSGRRTLGPRAMRRWPHPSERASLFRTQKCHLRGRVADHARGTIA